MALTKITSRILDSSGVTILGTIATGVWQGTPINQTYLVGQSGTNTGDETLARINALDVTELGTISSGVWNGTAINQTYLVGQSGTNTGDETLARINALDVTELGTISSGVWNGTVIASAYLDADTAHLSTTQTFTGAKTFSSGGIFSSSSQGKLKLVAGSNEYLSLEFANASGTTQWEISKNNTHDLYFYKGGYKMILKSGGNVGIGTASPISGFKLDVQGGDFRVGDDANQGFEAGYSAGSGNVFLQGYNRGTSSFVNMILNNALTISSGGDASFNGNVSLADTKYIQLNNTSTDWQLRADNAGKFIVQTSGGSEFFKIRNNGEIAFGNGTAFNQFFNVRSSSTSQSLINIGTSDNSEFLNVGVFGSAGYVMMENAAALNIGTGGVTRLSISSGGVITTGGSISNPFKITANPGTRSLKLTSASTNFGTFISWLRANETYEKAYLGFTSTSNDVFEINNRENADMTFHTNTTERMRISSGGEYSFGTPSSVTYSHGSNDGFHLRTGLELGFGNGNNNRPDFGINATGSGGGASLNIYCGEGSDDVDIQIAPNAVMQFNSGGIKFGSSGELLDTYEEGSWVVTLPSSSGASITTYRARYTVVGNVCHFQLYVLLGSIPSNTNGFYISLPITPDSTTNDYTGVSMGYCNNFNTNSWLPITNASIAYIYFHRNDGSSAVITNAQASGLPQLILSGYYYV